MNLSMIDTPRRESTSPDRRWWTIGFVVACLAAALYLRFHNLGRFPFWEDEFFHVFAAKSYVKDGSLTVPFYGRYTRAFPITWITAFFFRHFGVSEFSARAPFAATNVVFLLVSFLVIRRFYGQRAALATLFALTFSPFMSQMSHECRMYTVFQLLFFLWGFAFLRGFEPWTERPGWEGRWGIDARWLGLSAVLFVVSFTIHKLTVNGALIVAAYLVSMFVWEWLSSGFRAALATKYGVCLFAMLGLIALVALVAGHKIEAFIRKNGHVPLWEVTEDPNNFYRRLLSDSYPVFFFLYPLAAIKFIRDHGRRGFFAVLTFALLIVLHSYVFGRKSDRYIFYIFPFFILISAAFSADILVGLAQAIASSFADRPRWTRGGAWLAAVPVIYFFLQPWFGVGLRGASISKNNTAENHAAEVKRMVGNNTVIDTNPIGFLYYQGRVPDFYMIGEVWDPTAHGGRLIQTFDDLKRAYARPGTAVVVTEDRCMGNPAYFTPEMAAFIESHSEMTVSPLDRRIRYYTEKS